LKSSIENLDFLHQELDKTNKELVAKTDVLSTFSAELAQLNDSVMELNNNHSNLENKFSSLLSQDQSLTNDKAKLEVSIKEYKTKKSNAIKAATILLDEVKELRERQSKLLSVDYSQIDILTDSMNAKKDLIAEHNAAIKNAMTEHQKLQIPLPDETKCKHCRQPLSEEHRKICQQDIDKDIKMQLNIIQSSKKEIVFLNAAMQADQQALNSLNLSKQQLESINTEISSKNKDVVDKKSMHDEYAALLEKFSLELVVKEQELEKVKDQLKVSAIDEAKILQNKISKYKEIIAEVNSKISLVNKDLTHLNSKKAVIQHDIGQKTKDKAKLNDLSKTIDSLSTEMRVYPLVTQAFSSTGIPNLIIQNVLDDKKRNAIPKAELNQIVRSPGRRRQTIDSSLQRKKTWSDEEDDVPLAMLKN
jgi:chromosome segregation ATPase